MEERKLLWVVLLLALFILVVSGTVFYVYSPSKSQNYQSSEDLAILNEISSSSTQNKIDPDMWSRKKDTVPDFLVDEENVEPEKKITTVDGASGENAGKQYIDVSDSGSSENSVAKDKKIPEDVAKELRLDSNSSKKEVKKEEPKVIIKTGNNKNTNKTSGVASTSNASKTSNKTEKKTQKTVEKKVGDGTTVETVYWVQTASLTSRLNAEKARDALVSRHMKVEIFTKETTAGLTHRVRVGPFKNNTEAEYWLKNIKEIKGFERSYISQERIRV